MTAETFQPRYEALYRMWVIGSYSDRFYSELGRSLCSWVDKYPITPLTIVVISDNVEFVKQMQFQSLEAIEWFDRACVSGAEKVATYLQATYQFAWNDDDELFLKVGASHNIEWIRSLAQQLNLTELPSNTYRYIRDRETFNQLNVLDNMLKSNPTDCFPS